METWKQISAEHSTNQVQNETKINVLLYCSDLTKTMQTIPDNFKQ